MAATGAIDLSFRADLSNLTKQLAKMPDVTEKEAKEMVKALEKQFKSAEKAAERAAKAAGNAWKQSGRGAQRAGKDVGGFADQLKHTTEVTGEADSAIKGFGSAVGLVSPQAEKAFFIVGELAGSVEGLSRLLTAGMGPLAAITAALAVAGGAYYMLSQDVEEAEKRVADAREELDRTVAMFGRLDQAMAAAQFDLLAAQGKKSAEEIARHNAEMKAAALVSSDMQKATADLEAAQKALADGTKEYTEDITGLTAAQAHQNYQAGQYNKEHGPALRAAVTQAQNRVTALTKTQEEYAETLFKTAQQREKNNATQKRAARVTKETKDELQELIDKAKALLPAASPMQRMAETLAELQAEASKSDQAAARLKGSIDALNGAILSSELEAEIAAQDAAAEATIKHNRTLQEQANTLTNAATPIDKAETLLKELQAAAGESDQAFELLAPSIANVQQHLNNLQTEQAKAKLNELASQISSIGGNISQAASNIADIQMGEAIKDGKKALEAYDKQAEDIQTQIDTINATIGETTDERVKAQLEAEKLLLEGRLEANAKAKEEEKQIQNQAIADAHEVQKKINLAAIAMNTATAVMQAWAQLGPIGAPFATAGIVALGATQAAMVSAQEPPTLHWGGMVKPDERMIRARVGEGVLTPQGMQSIGGEAGLNAANAGRGMGGQIVVQQVYKHRVLDTVLADSIKRGGPISAELNRRQRRGRRNPHRKAS